MSPAAWHRAWTLPAEERVAVAVGEARHALASVARHVPEDATVYVLVGERYAWRSTEIYALSFPRHFLFLVTPPHRDLPDPETASLPAMPRGTFVLDLASGLNWPFERHAVLVDEGPAFRLWRYPREER